MHHISKVPQSPMVQICTTGAYILYLYNRQMGEIDFWKPIPWQVHTHLPNLIHRIRDHGKSVFSRENTPQNDVFFSNIFGVSASRTLHPLLSNPSETPRVTSPVVLLTAALMVSNKMSQIQLLYHNFLAILFVCDAWSVYETDMAKDLHQQIS